MRNFRNVKLFDTLQKRCLILLFLFLTAVNGLSWKSKAFADWYRRTVFPVLTSFFSRLSGLFPGSVGEILICAGICLALVEIVLIPVFVWDLLRASKKRRRLRKWNVRFVCWVLLYIYGTETLHCFIMYHTSTIEEQYYQEEKYGTDELVSAYSRVVEKANLLSRQVKRDKEGSAVFDGTRQELYGACKKAMQAQGQKYPDLSGYYPNPKPIRTSYFMSQQYLLGIYFPFTMEANYNTVMYPVNLPVTICHEFSHLKGVIREDEANFFGFAACIESEDTYLQYSGYLSVLSYLARQVRESVPLEIRSQLENADEQVQKDDVFLTKEQWTRTEKRALFSTETVSQAANTFLEKNLTMNGIADGVNSYSRVVRLVLCYYQQG